VAIQARALETHLIDFVLQPLWTCARHIRQRSCCTLFGSSAHCWNTGRSAPSQTMTREKKQVGNSIQDHGTEHTFAQAMRNACEKMRALCLPLTGACASWSCSIVGANFKCKQQRGTRTSDAEHAAGAFTRAWVALVLQVFGILRPGATGR
jgi:hypothetical protein